MPRDDSRLPPPLPNHGIRFMPAATRPLNANMANKGELPDFSIYATIVYGVYGLSCGVPAYLFFHNAHSSLDRVSVGVLLGSLTVSITILLAALLRRMMSIIPTFACLHLLTLPIVFILYLLSAHSSDEHHSFEMFLYFGFIPLVVLIVYLREMSILRARGFKDAGLTDEPTSPLQ